MTVTSGEGKQHRAGRRLHDQRLSAAGSFKQDDVAVVGSGPLASVDKRDPGPPSGCAIVTFVCRLLG